MSRAAYPAGDISPGFPRIWPTTTHRTAYGLQPNVVSQKVLVNRNDPLQRELVGVVRSITYAPRRAVEPDEQELILLAQIDA